MNPECRALAQRSGLGAETIIVNGTLPPAFDAHCELMSLPMALGLPAMTHTPQAPPNRV
jgi:hypothetical protein